MESEGGTQMPLFLTSPSDSTSFASFPLTLISPSLSSELLAGDNSRVATRPVPFDTLFDTLLLASGPRPTELPSFETKLGLPSSTDLSAIAEPPLSLSSSNSEIE